MNETVLTTHRVALPDDIDLLFVLLQSRPESVIVRDLFYGRDFPLTEVANGPFAIEIDGDTRAITGFDMDGVPAKLRILSDAKVEIIDQTRPTWTTPSFGGIRLYVPK